jgi:hypothetical protein
MLVLADSGLADNLGDGTAVDTPLYRKQPSKFRQRGAGQQLPALAPMVIEKILYLERCQKCPAGPEHPAGAGNHSLNRNRLLS